MAIVDDTDPEVRHADDRQRRFETIFLAESGELLTYALRRVDVREDAADVVADTFLVAWRRLDDVPQDGEARLWLYGVARNILSNYRRHRHRSNRLAQRLRHELGTREVPQPDSTTALVVWDALRGLDDADRELLTLTSWEGLTPAEIAIVLDVPPATTRTRLHRARHRLRHELSAMGIDAERTSAAGHVSSIGQPARQHKEGT